MNRVASRPLTTTLLAVIVGVLALAAGHLGASAEHLEDEGSATVPATELAFNEASPDDLDLPPAADLPSAAQLPADVDDDDDAADADAEALVENEVIDLIDDVVPTNPNAPKCANGLAPVLYHGVPVTDNDGSPVCVTPDGDGQPGEATPGQPGESGQASDSEGVVDPGGAGENPNG